MVTKKKQKLKEARKVFEEQVWEVIKDNTKLCKKHAFRLFLLFWKKAQRIKEMWYVE